MVSHSGISELNCVIFVLKKRKNGKSRCGRALENGAFHGICRLNRHPCVEIVGPEAFKVSYNGRTGFT